MRVILVLLGIAALVVAALMLFGLVNIDMVRPGAVQAPKFEADMGRVGIGSAERTVEVPTVGSTSQTIEVPTLEVERAGNAAAPAQ